jgi:hypothetical protein
MISKVKNNRTFWFIECFHVFFMIMKILYFLSPCGNLFEVIDKVFKLKRMQGLSNEETRSDGNKLLLI